MLHTAHEGVDGDLTLTFETMGPEDVGDVGHAVLATAMRYRNELDEETVRSCEGVLAAKVQCELDERERRAGLSQAERSRLETFIRETVCPQFAARAVWERVQNPAEVYVEEPVDSVVRIDGLDTELQSIVDVVTKRSDEQWFRTNSKSYCKRATPRRGHATNSRRSCTPGRSQHNSERAWKSGHISPASASRTTRSPSTGTPRLSSSD